MNIARRLSFLVLTAAACQPFAGPPGPPEGPAPQANAGTPSLAPASPVPTPLPDAPAEQPLTILLTSASTQSITIEVKDADFRPVRTDLWLYRWNGETYVPLSGIEPLQSSHRRRSGNFMLPADLGGEPTGFEPATLPASPTLHGVLSDGADRRQIDGKVDVTLGAEGVPDGTRILVAAALEDQRYYGARVFDLPGGVPSDAPLYSSPIRHPRRTWADVAPILARATCTACHGPQGQAASLPMLTYRDLVERNFKAPPGREFDPALAGEHMLEPGVPALSGLVRRTRPGLGEEARKWYGKPVRFNLDPAGNVVGDRRMPPQDVTGLAPDADGPPSYFDSHPQEYKVLWDWVAQGAPE